ncbi:MAG: hypothetical protein GEU75_00950 [Dehalococcoidia bacterium]|nr:hypothetical protein [Dehalococcoidia bacterium]
MARSESQVIADVLSRLDRDGGMAATVGGFETMLGSAFGRLFLQAAGVPISELEASVAAHQDLFRGIARYVGLFAPMGWAPSGLVPTLAVKAALEIYERTQSVDEAEIVLAQGWNESGMFRVAGSRLAAMLASQADWADLGQARARLIEKALGHHQSEAFEASVPIVLTQIDGLVKDMTGNKNGFFAHLGDRSHLQDRETLAGLDEGLTALQAYFGSPQHVTEITGGLSRHGILHGRELGYDTLLNSTKCFVLLLAIIEWAQPRARAYIEQRQRDKEAEFAGSNDVDTRGRRLDRREFSRLRIALDDIRLNQFLEYTIHSRYSSDLTKMLGFNAKDAALVSLVSMQLVDRKSFHAWAKSPSGWILGIAASDGSIDPLYYAGANEPPPPSTEHWRSEKPPDWLPWE